MARPTKLTPEVQAGIVESIKAGAFDWVAAQAAGVDPRTFYRWMAQGASGRGRFSQFCQEVKQARAHARKIAETEVFKNNPFAWLRYGPGREKPNEPGWTDSVELSGNDEKPVTFAIRPIDYRALSAPLSPRSVGDRDSSGEDQNLRDGSPVGEVGNGR